MCEVIMRTRLALSALLLSSLYHPCCGGASRRWCKQGEEGVSVSMFSHWIGYPTVRARVLKKKAKERGETEEREVDTSKAKQLTRSS